MNQIITPSDFCEQAGMPRSATNELVQALLDKQTQELALHEYRMQRCAARPDNQALALTDEEGNEYGRVEARIPKTLFFNLLQRENFGWEGLCSDEGMADILRDNPQCRVETVSGKIVSGYEGPPRKIIKRY